MSTIWSNAVDATENGVQSIKDGTWSGSPTTKYNVLVGDDDNKLANVAPSATVGLPLTSNGSSANPSFAQLTVPGGGTDASSFNINGAVISGSTSTSALSAVTLASQEILVGNVAGAPSAKNWQIKETLYVTGTHTHTFATGMMYALVQLQAAGGGGGGCAANPGNTCSAGAGGGAGAYTQQLYTASQVGASQSITIGTYGVGGNNTGGNGTNAANSSFGSLLVCEGGKGGQGGAASGSTVYNTGGVGGLVLTPGSIQYVGRPGANSVSFHGSASVELSVGGEGGSTIYGVGGQTTRGNASANAGAVGGGGSGSSGASAGGGGLNGGDGGVGFCIITEYILD